MKHESERLRQCHSFALTFVQHKYLINNKIKLKQNQFIKCKPGLMLPVKLTYWIDSSNEKPSHTLSSHPIYLKILRRPQYLLLPSPIHMLAHIYYIPFLKQIWFNPAHIYLLFSGSVPCGHKINKRNILNNFDEINKQSSIECSSRCGWQYIFQEIWREKREMKYKYVKPFKPLHWIGNEKNMFIWGMSYAKILH